MPVMGKRLGPGPRLLGLLAALALAGMSPARAAWEARDYSYVLLQGKVSAARSGEPLAGVTIEAVGAAGSFETTSDPRGGFVFDKLPVGRYDIHVLMPDGGVMKSVRDLVGGRRIRLEVRTGRGEGAAFTVHPDGDRMAADLPPLPARWRLFWAEVGILVGVLLLFAL